MVNGTRSNFWSDPIMDKDHRNQSNPHLCRSWEMFHLLSYDVNVRDLITRLSTVF